MDEMHKSYCLSFVEKYGNGVDLESHALSRSMH